jgi:hypothetical protein
LIFVNHQKKEVEMTDDEFLEFLFGKQAREDLERWGLPPEEDEDQ